MQTNRWSRCCNYGNPAVSSKHSGSEETAGQTAGFVNPPNGGIDVRYAAVSLAVAGSRCKMRNTSATASSRPIDSTPSDGLSVIDVVAATMKVPRMLAVLPKIS